MPGVVGVLAVEDVGRSVERRQGLRDSPEQHRSSPRETPQRAMACPSDCSRASASPAASHLSARAVAESAREAEQGGHVVDAPDSRASGRRGRARVAQRGGRTRRPPSRRWRRSPCRSRRRCRGGAAPDRDSVEESTTGPRTRSRSTSAVRAAVEPGRARLPDLQIGEEPLHHRAPFVQAPGDEIVLHRLASEVERLEVGSSGGAVEEIRAASAPRPPSASARAR